MIGRLGTAWRGSDLASYAFAMIVTLVLPLMIYEAWVERRGQLLALTQTHWLPRALVYLAIAFSILYFAADRPSEFIYFQF